MMKRIKEDNIKKTLKILIGQNLKVQIIGSIKLEYFIEKAKIIFFNDDTIFKVKDEKNNIIIDLSYVDEIFLIQKNKLKFLIDKNIEILICIL